MTDNKRLILAVVVDLDVTIDGAFLAAVGNLATVQLPDGVRVIDTIVRTREVPGGQVVRAEVEYSEP